MRILLFLLLPIFVFGQSYLLYENWEDTGANGWTLTGTNDPDNTSPAMERAENLLINGGGDAQKAQSDTVVSGDTWYFFLYAVADATPPSGRYVGLQCIDVDDGVIFYMRHESSGTLLLRHGNVNSSSTTTTLSNNTVYALWVKYRPGTGADGQADIYITTYTAGSSSITRPESPEVTQSDGAATRYSEEIKFESHADLGNMYFDYILVDDKEIGNVDFDTTGYENRFPRWPDWVKWPRH